MFKQQHPRSHIKRPESLPPTLIEAVHRVNTQRSKTSQVLNAERIYNVFRTQIISDTHNRQQPSEKKIWLIIANRTPADQYNKILQWMNGKHKITNAKVMEKGISASLSEENSQPKSLYSRSTEVATLLSREYGISGTIQDIRIEILNLKTYKSISNLNNEELINLFFEKRNHNQKNNPLPKPAPVRTLPTRNALAKTPKSPYDITLMNAAFYDPVTDKNLARYRSVISEGWKRLGITYPERSKAYWTLGGTDKERMQQLKKKAIIGRNRGRDITDHPDHRSKFKTLSHMSILQNSKGSQSL